jgi:hypothetical protein
MGPTEDTLDKTVGLKWDLGQVLVAHTGNPSCLGDWDWEGHSLRPVWSNTSRDFYLQNKQSKMGWRRGSSRRAPALQMQSSKFKPQVHHQKKKKKKKSQKTPEISVTTNYWATFSSLFNKFTRISKIIVKCVCEMHTYMHVQVGVFVCVLLGFVFAHSCNTNTIENILNPPLWELCSELLGGHIKKEFSIFSRRGNYLLSDSFSTSWQGPFSSSSTCPRIEIH